MADALRGLARRRRTLLYLLGIGGVLAAFYWPAASLQGIFYVGDIFRLNYPLRSAYAHALRQGRVPLWAPEVLGGYPILADGQTGSYYPLNLLLYRLLPVPAALNYSILLSLWVAGAGLFLYLRSLGLRRPAAFLAGCVFMLGGFMPAHLNHVNMLAAAAWLPLLLWAVERATRAARNGWLLVAAIYGLQGLAGHPQVLLLSGLLAGAYALVGPLGAKGARFRLRRQLAQGTLCVAALALGGILAAAQLVPSYELMRLSQRERALDYGFFTTFSMLPAELLTLLSPFPRGNPYPLVSPEIVGYVGALPLVLAAMAPLCRRNRVVAFWLVTALAALALVLGRFNPAYRLLWHVPVVNRFRAPARYLLWADLAIAVLTAVAVDALLAHMREEPAPRAVAARRGASLALAAAPGLWLARVPLDALLRQWRWLPAVWLGAAVMLLLWLTRRPPARAWLTLALGLVLADLGAFTGVYGQTYNDVMPPAEFARTPDPVNFVKQDAGDALYRIYTSERITPDLPVMRDSLYPNIQLLHGVQGVNGYFPLVPEFQEWLWARPDARLLDLLGVRYILVPQEGPADASAAVFVTPDPFAPSLLRPYNGHPLQRAAIVEVEGYLVNARDLPVGTPVCEVMLWGSDGPPQVWVLRAGMDLADCTLTPGEREPRCTVMRTWPLHFDLPGSDGLGRTYLARRSLEQPLAVRRVSVRPLIPAGCLRLERLRLAGPFGLRLPLPVAGPEQDHVLAYCAPGVAIYRNEGAAPRAFLVHRAWVAGSEEGARRAVQAPGFDPQQEVVLTEGEALTGAPAAGDLVEVEDYRPEYVRLRVATESSGYLVLADSYYPGWSAWVDGEPAPVRRADVALRAVAVPAGEHVVEFVFAPRIWRVGGWVSITSWLGLGVLLLRRKRQSRNVFDTVH